MWANLLFQRCIQRFLNFQINERLWKINYSSFSCWNVFKLSRQFDFTLHSYSFEEKSILSFPYCLISLAYVKWRNNNNCDKKIKYFKRRLRLFRSLIFWRRTYYKVYFKSYCYIQWRKIDSSSIILLRMVSLNDRQIRKNYIGRLVFKEGDVFENN